jgi:UDP-galactopyranose mutase
LKPKLVIVGSGFFGATIANLCADKLGVRVCIYEKRDHIGGNAYSYFDEKTKIEIHKYGSHLFHTSNQKVIEFISEFADFNNYRHTVKSRHGDAFYTMPINLSTISSIYGVALSPTEAIQLIKDESSKAGIVNPEANLRDKAISLVGEKLYESLLESYTHKQWQTSPVDLPADIITRLPVRFNFNDSYFDDVFQGLPVNGYEDVFNNMLSNKNIEVRLGSDFFQQEFSSNTPIVYTGALDRFFDYKFGRLTWRTLDFEIEKLEGLSDFQGGAVVNYADLDHKFTRIHEFKHLHPEREWSTDTVIMREFSRFALGDDEPYYPVNSAEDRLKLKEYRQLASETKNVFFGGRLGTYKYLDMHAAIASAIALFENKLKQLF